MQNTDVPVASQQLDFDSVAHLPPNSSLSGGRNVGSGWLELSHKYYPCSESLSPGIHAAAPSMPPFLLGYSTPASQKATHTQATGTLTNTWRLLHAKMPGSEPGSPGHLCLFSPASSAIRVLTLTESNTQGGNTLNNHSCLPKGSQSSIGFG